MTFGPSGIAADVPTWMKDNSALEGGRDVAMKTVFINPERCIGCLQCELACAVEHSVSKDDRTAFLEIPVPSEAGPCPGGPVPTFAFPNRCRHCDPAPCLQVCPTGAIIRDEEHDLVLIDAKKCIGCAMCAVVCPFDVITFHPAGRRTAPEAAVAVKCDGCVDRVAPGRRRRHASRCARSTRSSSGS